MNFFLVFLGGGIGSLLRYSISYVFTQKEIQGHFATFTVNIIGSFLIGLVLGYSLKSNTINQHHTLLLATGFCGGFTTFSSFAFENYNLLKNGDYLSLSFLILGTLILGIAAVFLGISLVK